MTFLGLLDAAVEVVDEGKQPAIGECFEEMAEVYSICFLCRISNLYLKVFLNRSPNSYNLLK